MTDLTINVEGWAKVLGVSVLELAYVQLENERRMDELFGLIESDGIYLNQRDGIAPSIVNWKANLNRTLGNDPQEDLLKTPVVKDMMINLDWVANVTPTMATLGWDSDGTLADGKAWHREGINLQETEPPSFPKLMFQTGFMIHPLKEFGGEEARGLAAYLGIPVEGKSEEELKASILKAVNEGT